MSKLDDIIIQMYPRPIDNPKQAIKDLFLELMRDTDTQRWGKVTSGNQYAALLRSKIGEL